MYSVRAVLAKTEQGLLLAPDNVIVTLEDTHRSILPHINPGDTIVCNIAASRIIGLPFVTRKVGDQVCTMNALIRCARRSDEGKMCLTTRQLHELYKHIVGSCFPRHPEIQTVDEYLTRQSYVYYLCDRDATVAGLLKGYKGKVPLPPKGVAEVLASWYSLNDVRLLRVLGVTDVEMEKSYMPPGEMYSRLLGNPFLVHSISPERASYIATTIGHVVGPRDVAASEALNKLAAKTIGSSNVFCPFLEFASQSKLKADICLFLQDSGCVVVQDSAIYLTELYQMEKSVAQWFARLATAKGLLEARDLSAIAISDVSGGREYIPDSEQTRAIKTALSSNVSVIVGPAGTGKTTIIKKIIAVSNANGISVECTSFTGKATAVIESCVGQSCKNENTKIVLREGGFQHLIIDEFSMQNLFLTYLFSCAFPHDFRLTLVGDPHQLEPIGHGAVLKELILSNVVPVSALKNIYRVLTEDGVTDCIIKNANLISFWKDGLTFSPVIEGVNPNVEIRPGNTVDLLKEIRKMHGAGVALKDFVILSPYNEEIPLVNSMVQHTYTKNNKCLARVPITGTSRYTWKIFAPGNTPGIEETTDWSHCFHVGDLVMCTQNNLSLRIYNGQEGIISDVTLQFITVQFAGREVLFSTAYTFDRKKFASYNDLILCSAVTVHLMQGSQRDIVIYYLPKATQFVTRSLTYVAWTRAVKSLLVIARHDVLCSTVMNQGRLKNNSLHLRLRELLPQRPAVEEDTRAQEEVFRRSEEMSKRIEEEYGIDVNGCDYDDYDY